MHESERKNTHETQDIKRDRQEETEKVFRPDFPEDDMREPHITRKLQKKSPCMGISILVLVK